MFVYILFITLLLLILLAVRAKLILYHRSNIEAVASPVSRALAELVAVAGGIYLSLVLLFSFLKLDIREIVVIEQYQIDPLAALALIIALVQPLVLSFWQRLKGK